MSPMIASSKQDIELILLSVQYWNLDIEQTSRLSWEIVQFKEETEIDLTAKPLSLEMEQLVLSFQST